MPNMIETGTPGRRCRRPLTASERQAKYRARIAEQITSLKTRLAWYEARFGSEFGPPPLVGLPPAPRGRHARNSGADEGSAAG